MNSKDVSGIDNLLRNNIDIILDSWQDKIKQDERLGDIARNNLADLRENFCDFLQTIIVDIQEVDFGTQELQTFPKSEDHLNETVLKYEKLLSPLEIALAINLLVYEILTVLEDGEELKFSDQEFEMIKKSIDALNLKGMESVINAREKTINQQSKDIMELSTPIIQIWDGIMMVPMIGTLDTQRTNQLKKTLLNKIVETSSPVALIDITGVPAIDTQTAQHLIETIKAVHLLGAEVVLTGVRPTIAQTLVQLGIKLPDIVTCSSLDEGLKFSLNKLNLTVKPSNNEHPSANKIDK